MSKILKLINVITCFVVVIATIVTLFIFPLTALPGDEMGLIVLMFLLTPAISLVLGLTNIPIKTKLLFPVIYVLLFILAWLFIPWWGRNTDVITLYPIALLIFSFIGLGVGVVINIIVKKNIDRHNSK